MEQYNNETIISIQIKSKPGNDNESLNKPDDNNGKNHNYRGRAITSIRESKQGGNIFDSLAGCNISFKKIGNKKLY